MKKKKKPLLSLKTKIFIGFIILTGTAVGIFFMTAPGKAVMQKVEESINFLTQKAHFELEQVVVEGHGRTQISDINRVLKLRQGMPIFDIDLEAKKEAVLTLPWIKTVRIERHLPTQVLISVTEKEPIAVWQNKKKYMPIDETGEPIPDDKTVLKNILLVVGEDAPQHTPNLIAELKKYPHIMQTARSAVRVGKRRWNLYLNDAENGLEIRLPEVDIDSALRRLQEFNDSGQILERDLKIIDLKLPDRLIVRSNETSDKDEKKK